MAFLTKLWTNSAPTAAFAAQTVQLDLSNYDAVLIAVRAGRTDGQYWSGYCFKDDNSVFASIASKINASTDVHSRGAKMTNSGVEFSTGYKGSTSGTNYAIPIYIFGVHISTT